MSQLGWEEGKKESACGTIGRKKRKREAIAFSLVHFASAEEGGSRGSLTTMGALTCL